MLSTSTSTFSHFSTECDRDQLEKKLLESLKNIKNILNWSSVKVENCPEIDHVLIGCLLYTDEKVSYFL